MKDLPTNIPDLEEPCLIFLFTKATGIPRGPITDVSNFDPGFMLQMNFEFFTIESICGFTSIFAAICYATSYPFGFPSRSKCAPIEILKFIVTTFSNYYKKVAFIWVDKDGALAGSSEFMNKCHNMNIICKTTGGDAYFLNGKIKISNNTLSNITWSLLLNSSHMK